MSKTAIKDHIIDAIATYICITAVKNHQFIAEVNTNNICAMLHATFSQQVKAVQRARELIREFE